jgi:hypothetical protein
MQYFRVRTLIDITRTNVFKESIDFLKKKQQDNFQTLHLTLEIRAIIFTELDPVIIEMDWTQYGYGASEKTWVWNIYTERDDLYLVDGDPCAAMRDDVDFIPFTTNCSESADLKLPFFSSRLKPTNILFEYLGK